MVLVLVSSIRRLIVTGMIVMGLSMGATVHATSFTSLVVFGDSWSDSGNIFDLLGVPNPPYTDKRFTSNYTNGSAGLVWAEHLAGLMGLPLINSVAGGTNYAFGGALATQGIGGSIPSLPAQLGTYLSDTGGVADPSALYVVFGGLNDVRDNNVADSASSMAQMIMDLATAGATNFFVPNIPDVGLTPESLAGLAPGGSSAVISAAAAAHNANLAVEIENLEATFGVNIISFDLLGLFSDVISDPLAFDLTNVTDACGGVVDFGSELCAVVDSYLFFDGIHPTAWGHQIIGEMTYEHIVAAELARPIFIDGFETLPPVCEPSLIQACYEGPVGTVGVGLCGGGTRTCDPDSQWGACNDWVGPVAEVCGDGQDNNCDGVMDDGCAGDVCDPLDSDGTCVAGLGCYIDSCNNSSCNASCDTAGQGQAGFACIENSDCGSGMQCWDGVCLLSCDPEDMFACSRGASCVLTGVTVEGQKIGACRLL